MDKDVKAGLTHLLADYAVLYQKLRSYHWDVTGPQFFTLHEEFENRYKTVAEIVDKLAERLRELGQQPIATMAKFLEASDLKEDDSAPPAETMVSNLIDDYVHLQKKSSELGETADDAGDNVTADLMDELGHENGEVVWMFSAFLGKPSPLG